MERKKRDSLSELGSKRSAVEAGKWLCGRRERERQRHAEEARGLDGACLRLGSVSKNKQKREKGRVKHLQLEFRKADILSKKKLQTTTTEEEGILGSRRSLSHYGNYYSS